MTCEVENLSTEHLRIECNRDTGCDDAVIINANGLEMIEGVTYSQIEYLEHATRALQDRFSLAARHRGCTRPQRGRGDQGSCVT